MYFIMQRIDHHNSAFHSDSASPPSILESIIKQLSLPAPLRSTRRYIHFVGIECILDQRWLN